MPLSKEKDALSISSILQILIGVELTQMLMVIYIYYYKYI